LTSSLNEVSQKSKMGYNVVECNIGMKLLFGLNDLGILYRLDSSFTSRDDVPINFICFMLL